MSNYTPFYISLILLILIGGFVPFIASEFITPEDVPTRGISYRIIQAVDNGIGIPFVFFELKVNPFSWFGNSFQESLKTYIVGFTIIPLYVRLPVLIIILFGFIWTLVKIFPFS